MGRVNLPTDGCTTAARGRGVNALLTSLMMSLVLFAAHESVWAAGPATASSTAATQPDHASTHTSSGSANDSAKLVAQIAAHLGQQPGVRAQFTQTRTLAALKAPLVSHGSMLFYRDRGVVWQIDAPYKTTWIITDGGVRELGPNGQPAAAPNPGGARSAEAASKMMRAMLGGDLSALYSQFDVQADGTPAQWHMLLTPNQPQLAQAIKSLQMSGGAYLQTLLVTLANGDATALRFDGASAVATLSPAEQALFEAH